MVRSMYSGVSGLRSHQTRMDTIGNNIANVNTYGFKSGRTTFRDIYYQGIRSAAEPTAAAGGQNPSSVGYGAQVGSVDLMMSRSTFTMTDQTMDLAIDGEGFFQVQDAAGNIFYTRAGMLNFDAAGNLVDMQGNFVLGINGDPTGKDPSSQRIQVNLPPVNPTPASVVMDVNGLEFTISATNPTTDGNLNFNFTTNASLADGEIKAAISTTGVVISMHPDTKIESLDWLNQKINDAITTANGGEAHPAGDFTINYTGAPADNPFITANLPPVGYYTAEDLVSTNYSIRLGSVNFSTSDTYFGGVYPTGVVGNDFGTLFSPANSAGTVTSMDAIYTANGEWEFTMKITDDSGAVHDYVGVVDSAKNTAGKFKLYNATGSSDDFVEMRRPSFNTITAAYVEEQPLPDGSAMPDTFSGDLTTLTTAQKKALVGYVDLSTVTGLTDPTNVNVSAAYNDSLSAWVVTIVDGNGDVHTATVDNTHKSKGTVTFKDSSNTDSLTATIPAFADMKGLFAKPNAGDDFNQVTGNLLSSDGSYPEASPSTESYSLGFSGTAFALRGGTAGGPQTIADMTNISIAPNGIITGLDSVGNEIIIGRIDTVTFANPAGLNQSGSSYYTESSNSGVPVLNQPGSNGAGKLVTGSLELSNVDLSREFSDMITTQRGYQANSRIITVSDTMLEELINLKR